MQRETATDKAAAPTAAAPAPNTAASESAKATDKAAAPKAAPAPNTIALVPPKPATTQATTTTKPRRKIYRAKRPTRRAVPPAALPQAAPQPPQGQTTKEPFVYDGASRVPKIVKHVRIGKTVKEIRYAAFMDCKDLETVECNDCLEGIGEDAFYGCESLKTVDKLPGTVERIGDFAFSHCFKLETAIFVKGIERIPMQAFMYCYALKDIGKLLSTTKVIGVEAFRECESLQKVELEEGLERIEQSAFFGCTKLKKELVPIPSTVKYIHDWALMFDGVSIFEGDGEKSPAILDSCMRRIRFDDNIKHIVFTPEKGENGRKCKLEAIEWNDKIESIGAGAFYQCRLLEDAGKLPPTLKVIKGGAFMCCEKLVRADFEEGVEEIGPNAFAHCPSLRDVGKLFSTVQKIDDSAFLGSDALFSELVIEYNGKNKVPKNTKHLRIGENVEEIENQAFLGFTSLETIEWNDRVQRIGSEAFSSCLSLRDIGKLPSTIQEIGYSAFKDCGKLQTACFETGVGQIRAGAFRGCKSLMSIGNLLSTVKVIEKEAFRGCYSLQHEIILPSSMTKFEPRVFYGCTMLQSIDIKEDSNFGLAMTLAAQYHYKTRNISMERLVLMSLREKQPLGLVVSQCETPNLTMKRLVYIISLVKPSSQEVGNRKEFFLAACPIEKVIEVKNACLEYVESIRHLVLWRLSNGPSLALRKSRRLHAGNDSVSDAIKDGQDVDANDRDERKMKKEANNEEGCKRALAHSESTGTAKVEKEIDDYLVSLIKTIKQKADEAGKGHLVQLNPGASAEALKNLAEKVPLRCPAAVEKLLKYTNGATVNNYPIPSVDEIIQYWHVNSPHPKLNEKQECYPFGFGTDSPAWETAIDPNGNVVAINRHEDYINVWGPLPLLLDMVTRGIWLTAEEVAKDDEFSKWNAATGRRNYLHDSPDYTRQVYFKGIKVRDYLRPFE